MLRLILLAAIFYCVAPRLAMAQAFISWNIRFDNPKDGDDRWDLRGDALVAEVLAQQPAIIGFQEVVASQLDFLVKGLPAYRHFGVGREDGERKGEFSPIFYNAKSYKLLHGQTLWLSPTPDVPSIGWDAAMERIATVAILMERRTRDSIWVVNTHFDHVGEEARLRSAELLVNALKPVLSRGQRIVLMGDFNLEPQAAPIVSLQQHFVDACPANQSGQGTFNGFDVARTQFPRIDYIWLSPTGWKVDNYSVPQPKTAQGRHVSDHFPVRAVLRATKK